MLSGAAVAQDITEGPVQDIQGANQYFADLSTTGLTLQAESEPVAGGAVTAEPSESPWLMDQQGFGPEAAPAQIANEVEQISEANQPLMESDLSAIAPVQEPIPPTRAESATIEQFTEVPEISSPTREASAAAASNASATTSELGASDLTDGTWSFKPPLGIYERQLFGMGIIVLTFVLAGFIVLWKLSLARVSVLDIIRGKSKQTYYHTREAKLKSSMLRAQWATDVPRRQRRHRVKHAPRRRDHRKYKDL
jgi:hypothetical protein